MGGCGKCSGNCESCTGCAGVLELTNQEVALLGLLGQYAFLPVGRSMGDPAPVPLDIPGEPEENSLVLQCMEKKGLVDVDFTKPLAHCDDGVYGSFSIRGSAGLTARGQEVLQLLEIQGIGG